MAKEVKYSVFKKEEILLLQKVIDLFSKKSDELIFIVVWNKIPIKYCIKMKILKPNDIDKVSFYFI